MLMQMLHFFKFKWLYGSRGWGEVSVWVGGDLVSISTDVLCNLKPVTESFSVTAPHQYNGDCDPQTPRQGGTECLQKRVMAVSREDAQAVFSPYGGSFFYHRASDWGRGRRGWGTLGRDQGGDMPGQRRCVHAFAQTQPLPNPAPHAPAPLQPSAAVQNFCRADLSPVTFCSRGGSSAGRSSLRQEQQGGLPCLRAVASGLR